MSAYAECSDFCPCTFSPFVLPYCRSIAEAIAAASFLHAPLGISKLHPIDANRLGQGRVCTTAINGVRTTVAAAVVSLLRFLPPCSGLRPETPRLIHDPNSHLRTNQTNKTGYGQAVEHRWCIPKSCSCNRKSWAKLTKLSDMHPRVK